jgi:predicted amidohydrolase
VFLSVFCRNKTVMRVAALQYASGTDVDENLATCLRMIDRAAGDSPDLMVMPEFSNHISWYDDADHARRVSLELEGEFLTAIADRAARHKSYIVINVALRRDNDRLTVTSLCYGPDGCLVAQADKQTLMGHENTWFARATHTSEVICTPFGRLAMFPCRDGVTCETPRGLALRGAQLFCDSLNSFALDEASLHVPARAPENKVFLVAANKIGPLIPEELLEAVSEQTHIPLRFLNGAGESQIVSPSGEILARGPRDEEAVVLAEIDLARAKDKTRPDGTDLFAARRPRLYRPIAEQSGSEICGSASKQIKVATLMPEQEVEAALSSLSPLVDAMPPETRLAVLPELFCYGDLAGLHAPPDRALAARAVEAMQEACAGHAELHLCASLVLPVGEGAGLVTVLVNQSGIVAQQAQLHCSSRYPWMVPGDELSLVEMSWGKLALVSGDDMLFPELVKVAALQGAHVIAAPLYLQESWEERYGLRSRAAENRVCLVASSRALDGRAGMIIDLEREFTLMTEWQERKFDGYINAPLVTEQTPGTGTTCAYIHPAAASNKLMSEQTDLLLDRPWRLSGDLLHSAEELRRA